VMKGREASTFPWNGTKNNRGYPLANPSKVLSTVRKVRSFGEGVYQVDFSLPSRFTKYLPGQFLHLTLDEFDPTTGYWPESRVFSIASEPRQETVTIVYSVKGRYTKRMEQELSPGKEVWLKLPYGDFVISNQLLAEGPVALIAGGTGVSPYWPFLKGQAEREGAVHLFYGIRKAGHLLFAEDLKSLIDKPWFHLHLMVEEGTVDGFPAESGRLSIAKVEQEMGRRFATTNFFLSGPPTMIRKFKDDLAVRGMENNRIHIDEWE
jgi:NAD(P)H-flavin reductase